MTLSLRAYSSDDRDACIASFRSNIPRYFREHEIDEYITFIDSLDCPYFVVHSVAGIVGCGGFGMRPDSDVADLCWGLVDSKHHRKRIGTFLLFARLNAIVSTTDAKSVRLGTSQLTDGFFRQHGFQIQARKADGIAEGLDEVEMRMELTEAIREMIGRKWREMLLRNSAP